VTATRAELLGDCARCVGICCVAPAFAASADFAIDKPAGRPCPHLGGDDRCTIHDRLTGAGFPGCVAYDCFGAGQRVTQVTFGGLVRRPDGAAAGELFSAFAVVRALHELLWYLGEVLTLERAAAVHDDARAARDATDRLAGGDPGDLRRVDVDAHTRGVDAVLSRAGELHRARHAGPSRRRADLAGARLRGARLAGADLRGAWLIGADLRAADLRDADLIGADLRGADLRAADLRGALFLTRPQLRSARTDAATRLPAWCAPHDGPASTASPPDRA
jgi:uncharacterized protein YjbI with pentapeptide repeats